MNDNNYSSKVFQGSLLVEEARPEKGFFIKSKERWFSLRDNKWHSKFSWEPVVVSDLWVDETDGKCQKHFRVQMADTTRFQVDQPISRQRYNLFVGYKLDAHRVDLIEKVLRGNKSGLCIRKWVATELLHMKVTKRLLDELRAGAKKCGQSLSQYCISLLSGKHPRAAFSEEELELLRNLKKERADVQLMFNAGQSGKAERHRRRHQNSRFQALRHRRPARRTRKIAQAGPRSRAFSLNFTKNS